MTATSKSVARSNLHALSLFPFPFPFPFPFLFPFLFPFPFPFLFPLRGRRRLTVTVDGNGRW